MGTFDNAISSARADDRRFDDLMRRHRDGALDAAAAAEERKLSVLGEGDPARQEQERRTMLARRWALLGEKAARATRGRYAWLAAAFSIGVPALLAESALADPAIMFAATPLLALAARRLTWPFVPCATALGIACVAFAAGAPPGGEWTAWLMPAAAFGWVAVATQAASAIFRRSPADVVSVRTGGQESISVRISSRHRARWNALALALAASGMVLPAVFTYHLPWKAFAGALGVPGVEGLGTQLARRSAVAELRARHGGPGSDDARQAAAYPGSVSFSFLDRDWGGGSGWRALYPLALVGGKASPAPKEPLWIEGASSPTPGRAVFPAAGGASRK